MLVKLIIVRQTMGLVYTDITLKNVTDVMKAKSGYIKEHDIRELSVEALADTGAWTLVIN